MNSHRHNGKKTKKFLTLRLWEFIDFELKYFENKGSCQHETHIILFGGPLVISLPHEIQICEEII
jgi:hypothetical protein